MNFDVAIIGGGAAGLAAAINIRQKSNLSVVVIESLDRVGKKLITTGNGRCNITNKYASVSDYHGNSALIKSVLDRFSVEDAVRFFESIGVDIVFEADGKGYPASLQASSVVDNLRLACDELGVVTLLNTPVTELKGGFLINGSIKARAVIMTGGLLSGGKKIGSDGSCADIARRLGHKLTPIRPSIVQLKTDTTFTRQLKGIKVDATASLIRGERVLRCEKGEVLFTDYGLSGPPILQLSRNAEVGTKIALDLMGDIELCDLISKLKTRKSVLSKRTVENFLTGLVNKRLGQVVLKACGYRLTDGVNSITDVAAVAKMLKCFEFDVMGNTGFANSQVSAGGVAAGELTDGLESKRIKNLFFAGEIIDVDGDCGGYNLQWAWASAYVCAEGVQKCCL